MTPQMTPYPRRTHLDPDRESRAYPAKWDLSSLPEPAAPVEGQPTMPQQPAEAPDTEAATARFFADLQLDPYLDGETSALKKDMLI